MQDDEQPGLLSPGLHPMDMDGIYDTCVTGVTPSQRRIDLFDRFSLYYEKLRGVQIQGEIWVDGSFVTSAMEPGDIDIVVRVHGDSIRALSKVDLAEFTILATAREEMKLRYGVDVYLSDFESSKQYDYWYGVYGTMYDNTTPKGIIQLAV